MKPPPPPPKKAKQKKRSKYTDDRNADRGKGEGKPRGVVGSATALVDFSRQAQTQQAVFRGMIVYIQNPGANLREVWSSALLDPDDEDSPKLHELVSYSTFESYSKRQNWSRKREEHWTEIEKRVLAEAKTDAVQLMLREVEVIDGIGAVLLGNITGVLDGAGNVVVRGALPKSLEGAVAAYIKLDEHRMKKRDRVMETLARSAGEPEENASTLVVSTTPEVADELTDDEVRALAENIVNRRALTDNNNEEEGEE